VVPLEIRIGVANNPREIVFESKLDAQQVANLVSEGFKNKEQILKFEDERGRTIMVPADQIAYLEIGAEEVRRVGFIA
jgi:hypothetical protein